MKYEVVFMPFTERHFVRSFARKHKNAWEKTLNGLRLEFSLIDLLFGKSIAEKICYSPDGDITICKTEFKISGTKESRHGCGNRCIVAIHKKVNKVCVLLVYNKNDLGGGSETGNWKRIIKENYPVYSDLL